MNYIINPMWFYWLSVVNSAKIISIVVAVMSSICFAGFFIGAICDDYLDKVKKPLIVIGAIMIVSTAIAIFVPNKQTLIEMQIAKFATYENAQWTLDNIKEAADYIIGAIEKMR